MAQTPNLNLYYNFPGSLPHKDFVQQLSENMSEIDSAYSRISSALSSMSSQIAANYSAISAVNTVVEQHTEVINGLTSTIETFNVNTWLSDATISPFLYKAEVQLSVIPEEDTIVELLNNNAIIFATYGFAIGEVSGRTITLYAIEEPVSSVSLSIRLTGETSEVTALQAPSITISGTNLVITDNPDNIGKTDGFEIYINNNLTATQSNTIYDLSYLSTGTYSINVKAYSSNYFDSDYSNTVSYEVIPVVESGIYGVSALYSSNTLLTRTDDAVGKSVTVNTSSGTVSSDFDSLFPWNEATVETINGNKFLHMPDMWFRVGKDSSNRITDIAVSKTQGSSGNWYKVDSFYYGCYGASNNSSKLASVSGVTRLHTQTRATFRQYAAANGSGYFQLDLYHRTVMVFLWLIEFANKDSQSIMRGVDNGTARNTGGTDTLSTPTGFNTSTQQMRYHYIEDFVGNYFEFVDGSVGTGSGGGIQYVSSNPSNYNDTGSGFNTLSWNSPTTSGNCLSALGWDDNNPFLCLPKETVNNGSYNTYFCDFASTSNNIVLYCGAAWDYSYAYNGVLCFYRNSVTISYNNVGGRLLYKP